MQQEISRSNFLPEVLKNEVPYPYFDTAVWIDTEGNQRVKRTIKNSITQFIPVSSRAYFRNLKEGRYRSFEGHEFWLEPILSKTTGRNEVEISMKVPDHPEWVSAFDTRLISLMQPVLPVGYGYSIVDNEGKVLFHSDETHHLGENFFQECDNNPALRSAVFNRAEMPLNVRYLGRGHRLFTTPVKNFHIWDSCSNEERLTLFHLAQDRLLSHNDPEIEQLLRRGLIVRDPDIHLLNESFRRFVKSEKGGQVMAEYEAEAKKGSQWQFLKTPLLVVLLSVILFLFITQRELYNSSLAIMTAITTAIPAFFKLLSLFQKDPVNYPVQPTS